LRHLRQIRLGILRVDDDCRFPFVTLVQQREQFALRSLREIANRAADCDIGSVNNELSGSADALLNRRRETRGRDQCTGEKREGATQT